jgi:hypothetical protein
MGLVESNPIHQRMEWLEEKFARAASLPGVSVIRIHARENEKKMVDAFFDYLLAVDTPNMDIPIHFESPFDRADEYAPALLKELEEVLYIWNHSKKDDASVYTGSIEWQPDHRVNPADNPASLFIRNMNSFSTYLCLEEGIHLVLVLKPTRFIAAGFNRWLESAIKAGIDDKIRILISDTEQQPSFSEIASHRPDKVITLLPELDMDRAMQQVAAMGDPNDPGTAYRKAFVRLMQAITKRDEADAERQSIVCIGIAIDNLAINPLWLSQLVVVYAALANDQLGYSHFQKAIAFASLGVEAAERSPEFIKEEYMQGKLIAQAVMLRGSLYAANQQWEKAIDDLSRAGEIYEYTVDPMLSMEAHRMTAYCADKRGDGKLTAAALRKALDVSAKVPANILPNTTFPGVLEQALKSPDILVSELEGFAEPVYGRDWLRKVANWKDPGVASTTHSAQSKLE